MSEWTQDPTECDEATVIDAVLALFPNASFGDDNDGQMVIYTDCFYTGIGTVMGEINLPEET